ncbi:MAG: AraC family transcriptional regulator [Methylovirgula sp.]|uniref:AraC family transcriptional regulator n=1 Tax=Methylovirgula sp. TaxID=1978224 RepID=UPI00307618DF
MNLRADGTRKYPNSKLIASSANRGWTTIYAELRDHPAGHIASAVQQNVEIVIALRGADQGSVTRIGAGRRQQSQPSIGTIWLVPIGVGSEEIILTAPMAETLHLYLPGRQFSRLAEEYNLPHSLGQALQYLGGLHDELIRQLGIALLTEMLAETSTSRMLAESASIMLAAQLSHRYSGADLLKPGGGRERPEGARLRRVLDYIEANIETDISVEALADVAALSVFHFTRLFTAAMGQPPRKYVSRRRLETAMAMLARDKFSLNEIAHKSRFSSQAAFSRAFRRATGMTPGEYRRLVR